MTAVSSQSATTSDSHKKGWLPVSDKLLLTDLFQIDSRSLAVVRIGLGLIILAQALFLSQPMATDVDGLYGFLIQHGNLLVIPFAGQLVLGYRTRLATLIVWLVYSVGIRHDLLTPGGVVDLGNYVGALLLFWGFFLPLGASWSLDARRRGSRDAIRVVSMGSAAFLIQMFLIYFSAGITKHMTEWVFDATALHTILSQTDLASEFGRRVAAEAPELLAVLSIATIVLEIFGSVLLFIPGKRLAARRVVLVGAFIALHLGMILFMDLAIFPFVMVVSWFVFLPSEFWDRLGSAARTVPSGKPRLVIDRTRWITVAAGTALGYVVVSNLITRFYFPAESGLAAAWQQAGKYLLIYQQWAMFSLPSSLV